MTISYPLDWPTVTGVKKTRVRMRNLNKVSQSPFTLSQQVIRSPGRRWEFDITLPRMKHAEAKEWVSWIASLEGQLGTFYFGSPMYRVPGGSVRDTDTVLVNGAVSSGREITFDDAPASVTGYIKAGDHFHIGTGSNRQLFKALKDVDTDGSGGGTIDVWPNVRTSIADNSAITFENAQGVFRLANNTSEWDEDFLSRNDITLSIYEAIVG